MVSRRRRLNVFQKAGLILCLPCLAAVWLVYPCCSIAIEKSDEAIQKWRRSNELRRLKKRKLPVSQPLALRNEPSDHATQKSGRKTSFLDLPVDVRIHIYEYVFGDPGIYQVALNIKWGPFPNYWGPGDRIRHDGDLPSVTFRTMVGLGADGLRQDLQLHVRDHSFREGFKTIPIVEPSALRLICGDGKVWSRKRYGSLDRQSYLTLMSTCRTVYTDLLHMLYSENTFSFFGVEMIQYLLNNANPEGLSRLRYAHVGLIVSGTKWNDRQHKKEIENAMRSLRERCNIARLDVEIAVTEKPPDELKLFWSWLMGDLFAQFKDLEQFVLKIGVVRYPVVPGSNPPRRVHIGSPSWDDLPSWDEEEYQQLKARVMA